MAVLGTSRELRRANRMKRKDEGNGRTSNRQIAERLRVVRDKLGISQSQMAARIGLGQSTFAGYESGNRRPPLHMMLALEHEFYVNHRWLVTGEGQPLLETRSTRPVIVTDRRELQQLEKLEGRDHYYVVPYLRDAAAAGPGLVMEEQIDGYCIIHQRVAPRPSEIRCVRVSGESMAPTLTDGSIVAVNVALRDPGTVEGKIVCVRTADGEVAIKRLRTRTPHLLLVSDNPDQQKYPPLVVDTREVEQPVIGKVVWAWVDLR